MSYKPAMKTNQFGKPNVSCGETVSCFVEINCFNEPAVLLLFFVPLTSRNIIQTTINQPTRAGSNLNNEIYQNTQVR